MKFYGMQQSLEGNLVFNAYIREEEISQINTLSFHLKNQKQKSKLRSNKLKKEMIKIRVEINEIGDSDIEHQLTQKLIPLKRSVELKSHKLD